MQNVHASFTSRGTMAAGPDGVDLCDAHGSGRDGRAGLGWMADRPATVLPYLLCCAVLLLGGFTRQSTHTGRAGWAVLHALSVCGADA